MNIIMHGDDYGRSVGITNYMKECLDSKALNSVSIPVSGYGFEEAVEDLRKRVGVRASLHLDLVEGPPTTSPELIPLLLNKDGYFYCNFFFLWARYLLSSKSTKAEFERQVNQELKAQIEKFKKAFPEKPLEMDSHQHMHMIPFVFKQLVKLSEVHKITYIRLGNEPWFFNVEGFQGSFNYTGPNLIKHILLKLLTAKYRQLLRDKNINYPDYFVGLLFTGNATLNSVKEALAKISGANKTRRDLTIEILFHVCKAAPGEEHLWERLPGLRDYYYSENRDMEKKVVMSKELKQAVDNFMQGDK